MVDHRAISQEEAMNVLGFQPPYNEIRFGPFTGNKTLLKWFQTLNQYYKVQGKSFFSYYPKKTVGKTPNSVYEEVKTGILENCATENSRNPIKNDSFHLPLLQSLYCHYWI